jgi:hypothetical protein
LLDRSQQYLDSIRSRSIELTPDLREKIESQAKIAVNKGLAKLNRPAELVQKQAESADDAVLSEAMQKAERIPAQNTAEFLSRGFHRPTELEVAVRVALPYWNWLQQFGMFLARNPVTGSLFGSFGLDSASCNAVIVPTPPRNVKTFTPIPGQLSLSTTAMIGIRRFADDNLLTGFTLIAQTVIRRE